MQSLMKLKFKQNAAALQHLSAEFNAYCWSDSACRLQSRPESPDQYSLLLVFAVSCGFRGGNGNL